MDVALSLRPAAAALVLLAAGCFASEDAPDAAPLPTLIADMVAGPPNVTAVTVAGEAGAYTFSVTVRSQDTGCEGYADWWEVVSPSGELLYRRVLLHSHVDEQPFTRSGGPVRIGPDDTVVVRAHMSTGGYGEAAYRGSVEGGFGLAFPPRGFAVDLEEQSPLPSSCAF